jgi:hypothetical protein
MTYTLTDEDVALLKRIGKQVRASTDGGPAITAGYIPPAKALRLQADEIERRDADTRAFHALLHRIEQRS